MDYEAGTTACAGLAETDAQLSAPNVLAQATDDAHTLARGNARLKRRLFLWTACFDARAGAALVVAAVKYGVNAHGQQPQTGHDQ